MLFTWTLETVFLFVHPSYSYTLPTQPEGLPRHQEGPLWAAGKDGLPGCGLLGSLLHLEGAQDHWENTLNLHLETKKRNGSSMIRALLRENNRTESCLLCGFFLVRKKKIFKICSFFFSPSLLLSPLSLTKKKPWIFFFFIIFFSSRHL